MESGCIGYPKISRYISIIGRKKAKTAVKRRGTKGKWKNAKQHRHTRLCMKDTRPCTSDHGPWWAPRAAYGGFVPPGPFASSTLRFALFGASIWAAGFAYVGSFRASFASIFDLHGPQLHSFSYYLA